MAFSWKQPGELRERADRPMLASSTTELSTVADVEHGDRRCPLIGQLPGELHRDSPRDLLWSGGRPSGRAKDGLCLAVSSCSA